MSITVELSEATGPRSERADLLAFLRAQRRSVHAIVEGLDEDAMRQVAAPSGWTPLGLIEHLAHAERFWFQQVVAGQTKPLPGPPERDDFHLAFVSSRAPNEVLAFYLDQCHRSDTVFAATSLSSRPAGNVPASMTDEIRSVRAVVLHMIEETARHAGHLDIAREQFDGRTGLGPR
ncbi:MAG: DinB family protein [Nocardioidaceae bacterium]